VDSRCADVREVAMTEIASSRGHFSIKDVALVAVARSRRPTATLPRPAISSAEAGRKTEGASGVVSRRSLRNEDGNGGRGLPVHPPRGTAGVARPRRYRLLGMKDTGFRSAAGRKQAKAGCCSGREGTRRKRHLAPRGEQHAAGAGWQSPPTPRAEDSPRSPSERVLHLGGPVARPVRGRRRCRRPRRIQQIDKLRLARRSSRSKSRG